MKQFFTHLSIALLSVFMVLLIAQNQQQLVFSSYDAVDVTGKAASGQIVARDQFEEALSSLAKQENSLIARRVVTPNASGQTQFRYRFYGQGEAPAELSKASHQAAQSSELVNSYLIVSGPMSSQTLVDFFSQMGYAATPTAALSLPGLFASLLASDIVLVSLLFLLLTYLGVLLIYRIRDLRYAGIRLVSGQSLLAIMGRSFVQDSLLVGQALLVWAILGGLALAALQFFQRVTIWIYLFSLAGYALCLVAISLGLSVIYLMGLKASSLVAILKGRLPLKRLLALMFVGQFLAFLLVAWAGNQLLAHYQNHAQLVQGRTVWQKEQDYYQLSYSYGAAFTRERRVTSRTRPGTASASGLWQRRAPSLSRAMSAIFSPRTAMMACA